MHVRYILSHRHISLCGLPFALVLILVVGCSGAGGSEELDAKQRFVQPIERDQALALARNRLSMEEDDYTVARITERDGMWYIVAKQDGADARVVGGDRVTVIVWGDIAVEFRGGH